MAETVHCSGTSKQTGQQCRQPPIPGGTVCRFHGGNAPQVRAAANRRLVEQEATRELAKAEVVPLGDPVVALADLAAESIAFLEVAKRNAAEGAEPDAAWMALYERAMDRCHRMLEACGRLGLEERRVRVDEARQHLANELVRGVLRLAGLDPDAPQVQDWIEATLVELERPE